MEVIQVETPVSAKEFKKHFGEKKHALVAYLAPWCGHCKEFKPEWRELSKRMKGSKRRGMLAAVSEEFIDAGDSRHSVEGYPTIRLFVDGRKVEDYDGPRKAGALAEYIAAKFPMSGGGRRRRRTVSRRRRMRRKTRRRKRRKRRTRRRRTRRNRRRRTRRGGGCGPAGYRPKNHRAPNLPGFRWSVPS